MSEILDDAIYKDQIGFYLRTQLGTILYVPINFTALIYGFRYIGEIGGSVGTVVAEIDTQKSGTITGTIDVVSVQPGRFSPRDSVSGHAIARGNAGEYIVGAVLMVHFLVARIRESPLASALVASDQRVADATIPGTRPHIMN
jgi:hypothetical protein